jgi:hypothetical protein
MALEKWKVSKGGREMTNEQINITIAEACGWREVYLNQNMPWGFNIGFNYSQRIPNFCGDLNAMHEAEKTLILTKRGEYLWHLALICCNYEEGSRTFETTTATARQRAEAFLKTLGKWEGAQ